MTALQAAWTVVLPVKPFAAAKSRLAGASCASRRALAHAFFRDTLEAVLGTAAVTRVLVVTDDQEAAAEARYAGAVPVPDRPPAGLNAAVRTAARHAQMLGHSGAIAVLTADLPALRSTELATVLHAASGHQRAFLADHAGCGTTVLTAAGPQRLEPAFEGNSRDRHRRTGAYEIVGLDAPGARLDIDTPDDLRLARRLGLGPHTRAVIARSGPAPSPRPRQRLGTSPPDAP
ncbi:2-phospho-L-lactate guanylyltransferase [Streptomyces sp. NPDC001380]|uniref:2-phospho-L-lactate guanylyltransferase n=1 Tax=Streptomyces sp. NPDC001380 TaxID=3364566 RepID=UPI0036B98E54